MTAPQVHADMEAERSVLGAVLLAETSLVVVDEENVLPTDFYWQGHGVVFDAMLSLQRAGHPVDVLTVRDELARRRCLTSAGGAAAVEALAASVPSLGNLRRYCQIVRAKARWRERQAAGYRADTAVETEDEDAYAKALAAADHADSADTNTRVVPADDFMAWMERGTVGIPTPWPVLTDALGGGLLEGDVTVIGGWPGMGKSIVADMIAEHAARSGARTHIYMSEMLAAARTARWLAGAAQVPFWRLMRRDDDGKPPLDMNQWGRVLDALGRVPYEYERIEGWPVERICRHLRRHRYDLAVVDTATRIPARDTQEVQTVSGMLTDTARETGCHVVLVLQLNLERNKTPKKPAPLGRDLLGGGAWWRDARNVLFVHRDQEEMGEQERVRILPEGKLYADKATHGDPERAYVPLTFVPDRMRFVDRDETGLSASNGHRASYQPDAFLDNS